MNSLRSIAVVVLLAALAAVPAAQAGIATDEMTACAALGAKRPGNAAGRAMAARIEAKFRAAGLQVHHEDFRMPVYTVRGVQLQVLGAQPRTVPGETFAYGGTGTVEGEVVDVGTGRESDYQGKDAKGKIVMVDRNEAFHRTSQLTQVLAHGGIAMLYVSGSPDNLVQIGAVRFAQAPPATIPTVTVGKDDGTALRDRMGSGPLKMRITVDAERYDGVARNVIGIRKGTKYPDRYVIAAGHYDSWHGGAVDNCSSMGSLLEVVDATKDLKPAYTIVYGAWDAEEPGLVGSYDWAMRHLNLVPAIVMDENYEMTSAATYVGNSRLDYSAENLLFGTASPAMNALVYQAAARNAFVPAPTTANGVRAISGGIIPTDLQPFYALGVQGFSTFSSTPYYHTIKDDADKIDPASHERVTGMLRDFLVDLQQLPPESLALREVPSVTVKAPGTARPGAKVPVEIRVVDPGGQPVTGVPVRVLVDQRDHWAVAEGAAKEKGDGVYTYDVPAGVTEADMTSLQATVDQTTYIAQGFARVDQRRGGPLKPARACRAARVLKVTPRKGWGVLRAAISQGGIRLRGRGIRVDLRRVRTGVPVLTVRARDARGRVRTQKRSYPPCQKRLP